MKQATREPRIGLFGGTFNPIHLGHLRAAEEVRETLGLESVLFIPSRIPPHKPQDALDPIASPARRLEWVERAIEAHAGFSVDRVEIDREGPSYLVDTLVTLRDRMPEAATPVFIVGQDAFAEMGEWREPEQIFELADLAVMTRPPNPRGKLDDWMPKIARATFEIEADGRSARDDRTGRQIELVSITALDISSSQIRKACREERSIRFLVPESIREAVERSGEYESKAKQSDAGGSETR